MHNVAVADASCERSFPVLTRASADAIPARSRGPPLLS
jgi:hypothetical protein